MKRDARFDMVEAALQELSPKACDWDHEVDWTRYVGEEDISRFLSQWVGGYERWEHLVGQPNSRGVRLTAEMLTAWANDLQRKLECVHCGCLLDLDVRACPSCREYEGIQPHVPGWSDPGESIQLRFETKRVYVEYVDLGESCHEAEVVG